jgi:hypothetical protein
MSEGTGEQGIRGIGSVPTFVQVPISELQHALPVLAPVPR